MILLKKFLNYLDRRNILQKAGHLHTAKNDK